MAADLAEVDFDQVPDPVLLDRAVPVFDQVLIRVPTEEPGPDGQHHLAVDRDHIIEHITVTIDDPIITVAIIIAHITIEVGGIAPISGDDTIVLGIIPPYM